jgi:5'-3' exonuclease
MPWLWVVLLPFIDEDRLLAALSPTMTQWTKEELLCNARGLDDGYLYVHREQSLAKKFAIVLQRGKTAKDPKTKLSDAASYGCPGFSGLVRLPLTNELFLIDEEITVKPPASAADKITDGVSIFADDIAPNVAACVAFSEPPR